MESLIIISTMLTALLSYKPTHITVQTGSYSGMIAYGAGYELEYYTPEILLGYTPSLVGGEDLYSISFKNSIHPGYFDLIEGAKYRPYGGINIISSLFDEDTFIKQPSQYPDGYYPANGVRTAPFMGIEAKMDNVSIYFEVIALDLYLETYYRSDGALHIKDASTYGIGWRLDL